MQKPPYQKDKQRQTKEHCESLRRPQKLAGLFLFCFLWHLTNAQVKIAFDVKSQPVSFGVAQLEKALRQKGQQVQKLNINSEGSKANILVQVLPTSEGVSIQKEGFALRIKNGSLLIIASDSVGAMYGALDVAEQIRMGRTWQAIKNKKEVPKFSVRALKFNLPWLPYRVGPAMDEHLETCRDLKFWQRFLDQMAENRFNLLSLWSVHPFSFMVKPLNFPKANNYSEKEMAEWKTFWTSLFRMAKERGIQPFLVNWNIAVSPEFAKAYGVRERNDTSAIVKRYTREVVTQVINEYPDLAGIGITLADWMSNFTGPNSDLPQMTPKDREDWIEETVVAGMKAANRPVQFLHRSVLSSDPKEMRRVIHNANLPDTTLVEIKFNWSHGHSTPVLALTHDSNSGQKDDGYWNPLPSDYRIEWMIRNEDFFILRWGQPDFIRQHIAQNAAPYVNGYFVGSEGYIPAKDFSHVANGHKTWNYAFEKQWLFYQLWGRLLYDPATPDAVFEASFNNRYQNKQGTLLLKAFAAASRMPLQFASFHGATWDYTLYSEGFLAPFASNGGLHDTVSSFVSINELIDHPTLDPAYLSIPDYVKLKAGNQQIAAGKITPLALADSLERDSKTVLAIVKRLRPNATAALACELDDLETWAYLSKYFAGKLRAGVALQSFRVLNKATEKERAISLLMDCLQSWKKVASITSHHYKEVPYVDDHSKGGSAYKDALRFSWSKYLPQVERDIELAKAAKENEKPVAAN
jgi:hypothetical protein